jgi:UDP-galactopyranose mutase
MAFHINFHSLVAVCEMSNSRGYLVVGCGLSGVTVAERIASVLKEPVLIIEKRSHIAGNCYDYIDDETDVLMNKYGAHFFHTNSEKVWEYVNRVCDWKKWHHEVLSYVDGKYVPMPVNIDTVNILCDENIQSPDEMDKWLEQHQCSIADIANSEDMARSRVGDFLYNKLVKNYTFKQWGKYPAELDASVLARIPVRNNFDTGYFSDKYQALPVGGYTHFFEKMLANELISCELNTDFMDFKLNTDLNEYKGIIYTGPIDQYFGNVGLNSLEYRGIDFTIQRAMNVDYVQPSSVVNYPGDEELFTRVVEYKHILNQKTPHTVYVSEVTNSDSSFPCYPVPDSKNLTLYEQYRYLAEQEERNSNVYFLGRLANYKYFNMDEAILNSLDFFEEKILSVTSEIN